ncbi:hypothetical protein MLD38_025776 [Melastoma candidum]|uniref:Uncharacterized protein n=1 Tax=Melastoma candidum TaxID=119954 RepID=A0ACB9NWD0_9MYRT|nr:hypothetical protein MLD38_025776 [Melastoma candidum]
MLSWITVMTGLAFPGLQALQVAFKAACNSEVPGRVVVPPGTFTLNEALFQGPCKSPIEFLVQATIRAPSDTSAFKTDGWVVFSYINGFKLYGGGVFDGQGMYAWTLNDCHKTFSCRQLPMNLRFNFVSNGLVKDITSKDSKSFQVNVLGCNNLTFDHVTVTAPDNSPNTDGIHIGRSSGIYITNSNIGTGDDCISLGDGSKDVHVTGVKCGPGHGISVGSLGKYQNEDPVTGFYVKNCTLTGTMNGIRIKTWPASYPGVISDMQFENIRMDNVGNPVIIDQEYCPWNLCKRGVPSLVRISNITIDNVHGTSSTPVVVNMGCSPAFPCKNVRLGKIYLGYNGPQGRAVSVCSNVSPTITGTQVPPACTT